MSTTSTTPALPGVVRFTAPEQARRHAIATQEAEGTETEATGALHFSSSASGPGGRATPSETLTEDLVVECDEAGRPYRLCWRGRWHVVLEEPLRWFERRRWWVEDTRVERGRGPGVVDHEIWRLQVRLEAASRATSRTVDLSRHTGSGRWRMLRVHDAAA